MKIMAPKKEDKSAPKVGDLFEIAGHFYIIAANGSSGYIYGLGLDGSSTFGFLFSLDTPEDLIELVKKNTEEAPIIYSQEEYTLGFYKNGVACI